MSVRNQGLGVARLDFLCGPRNRAAARPQFLIRAKKSAFFSSPPAAAEATRGGLSTPEGGEGGWRVLHSSSTRAVIRGQAAAVHPEVVHVVVVRVRAAEVGVAIGRLDLAEVVPGVHVMYWGTNCAGVFVDVMVNGRAVE